MTDMRTAVAAWESLFRAQVTVMRHLGAEFPTDEISLNEYDVMFNLSQQDGWQLRIRDLNELLLITQPSISRLIDRLVARGYVSKCHDPSDARGILVKLTDDGFQLFRRVAVTHMESITARVGRALSEDELKQLTALSDKLRTAVTE